MSLDKVLSRVLSGSTERGWRRIRTDGCVPKGRVRLADGRSSGGDWISVEIAMRYSRIKPESAMAVPPISLCTLDRPRARSRNMHQEKSHPNGALGAENCVDSNG